MNLDANGFYPVAMSDNHSMYPKMEIGYAFTILPILSKGTGRSSGFYKQNLCPKSPSKCF